MDWPMEKFIQEQTQKSRENLRNVALCLLEAADDIENGELETVITQLEYLRDSINWTVGAIRSMNEMEMRKNE